MEKEVDSQDVDFELRNEINESDEHSNSDMDIASMINSLDKGN